MPRRVLGLTAFAVLGAACGAMVATGDGAATTQSESEDTPSADCEEIFELGRGGAERPQLVDGYLFWSSPDGQLRRRSFVDGASSEILVTTDEPRTRFSIRGGRVIYTTSDQIRLQTVGIPDSQVLANSQERPQVPVWVGPDRVYWVDLRAAPRSQVLMRWDADTLEVSLEQFGWGRAGELVSDEEAVYALVGEFPEPNGAVGSRLVRYDDASRESRAIVTVNDAVGLVIEGRRLVWIDRGSGENGTIRSLLTDGTEPQVLATIAAPVGVGMALAVDENDLYFSAMDDDASRVFRVRDKGEPQLVLKREPAVEVGLALTLDHAYVTLATPDQTNAAIVRVCR